MARIRSIHIYPIKGMRGISLPEAWLRPEGLEHDRRWMLVDEQGTFLSQRTHPQMARFVPNFAQGRMEISYEGDVLEISLDELGGDAIEVSVFDDAMRAAELPSSYHNWFSERMGQKVRLVRHGRMTERLKNFEKYVDPVQATTITPVSFADGYPYLLLGTASMDLLNSKLSEPLPADRFRANILLQTDRPHEEDEWGAFRLGTARMRSVKPCARCQVTTIDQETGKRGPEPLRTLATYRRVGNKVMFGANAVMVESGRIRVGDELYFD